jgi:hypothetical protein
MQGQWVFCWFNDFNGNRRYKGINVSSDDRGVSIITPGNARNK